jgi:hypothetical protein
MNIGPIAFLCLAIIKRSPRSGCTAAVEPEPGSCRCIFQGPSIIPHSNFRPPLEVEELAKGGVIYEEAT